MGIYRDLLIRELKKSALSERTHESYIWEAQRLFSHFSISPVSISQTQVTDWLLLLKDRGYASSSLKCAKCGLRFFFTHVVPRPEWTIFDEFKIQPYKGRRPSLSVTETWRVLDSIRTPHNRAALVTIYLCGLRISECVNLQVGDIHSADGSLHVHRGKGAKNRDVPLPEKGLQLLRNHWKTHRNPLLVFPARGRGGSRDMAGTTQIPLPLSSIQTVFKKAVKEVGIHKRDLSVHSLRHSYATHLLELGVPTEHVRVLMGHAHLSTTEKYIHITRSGFADTKRKINTLAEPYHGC